MMRLDVRSILYLLIILHFQLRFYLVSIEKQNSNIFFELD